VFLERIPKLEFEESAAKLAGMIYRDLKAKGKLPKVKDLLIASSSIAKSKKLFACDSDFKLFENYGLKLEAL